MKNFAIILALAGLIVSSLTESASQRPRRDRYSRNRAPRLSAQLVQANNAFAIRLFKQVDRGAGSANTFLSPYSITTALALLYNGSAGTTRGEIARALDIQDFTLEQVNQAAAAFRDVLEAPESGIRVSMANGIWLNNGNQFPGDFLSRIGRFFRADATDIDFREAGAEDEINDWVADKTRDKIDYLFADEEISRAEAVLANAVYFHGRWQRGFDASYTQDRPFMMSDGTRKSLPMMRRTLAYPTFHGGGVRGVGIPYGKGSHSFYAFLPDEGQSLTDLIAKMDAGRWYDWMARLTPADDPVTVTVPRFKVTQEAMLTAPLSALGMGTAFTRRADYAPMGLFDSCVNVFKHKASLELSESGLRQTELRNATGSGKVARVTLDRPFLCAVRDNRTGAILFLGAIRAPEANKPSG